MDGYFKEYDIRITDRVKEEAIIIDPNTGEIPYAKDRAIIERQSYNRVATIKKNAPNSDRRSLWH